MWLKFGFQIIRKLSQSSKFPFRFYFGFHFYGSPGCVRLFTYHKICWSTVAENPFQKTVCKKTFMMTECNGWGRISYCKQNRLDEWQAACLPFPHFFLTREQTSLRLPIHPLCPQLNWDCASEGGQPSRLLEYDWATTTALWSKWLGASH